MNYFICSDTAVAPWIASSVPIIKIVLCVLIALLSIFMIIAVSTEWNDNSGRFAYYRIENGKMKEREEALPPDDKPETFAKQLYGLEVDLLIASNVTKELEEALSDEGVFLVKTKPGRADAVLAAYLSGDLEF